MNNFAIKYLFWLVAVLLNAYTGFSQTPTNQDCLGAIPVCQYTYSQTNSFSGTGNYPNEINDQGCPQSCLLSGEKNDVWYIFTVQTSGNLSFNITPSNSSDDYDWAVYNLTNANCSNIFSNASLQVSCNFSASPGTTGANGNNSQNCGDALASNDNAVIPVYAGQTYVLNISNYSSTQYGYTLNFSSSTASIFDNIPPALISFNQPVTCGASQITVNFSENVMCNTASTADFLITGPGGPYTVTSIYGSACGVGASMENTFTLGVSPPITQSGDYQICLTNNAGSVADACGNLAAANCFNVHIQTLNTNVSVVNANCGPNGSASIFVSGGNGSYTYNWNTVPTQNSSTATGLNAGVYYVTVSDGNCTAVDTASLIDVGGPTISLSSTPDHCYQGIGTATVVASGGTGSYSYHWETMPVQTSSTAIGLAAGSYMITVSDGTACPAIGSCVVSNLDGPQIVVDQSVSSDYGMHNGSVTVSSVGGASPISYTWLLNPIQLGSTATGLSPGNYTVVAIDAFGCSDTLSVYVGLNINTYLTASVIPEHCGLHDGAATVLVHEPIGAYTIEWNTTPPQYSATISGLTAGTTYQVTVTDSIGPYTIFVVITKAADPNAAFSANPNPSTIGSGPILFINESVGATSWSWSFGDGNTSVEQYPRNTYITVGEYVVSLFVQNDYGCADSVSKTIIVNDLFAFYIPNTFSPNGDGKNDFFSPSGISVDPDSYLLRVYDRWGQLVFHSSDINVPWNGTVGEKIVQGTYSYYIEVCDMDKHWHVYRGKITLLF